MVASATMTRDAKTGDPQAGELSGLGVVLPVSSGIAVPRGQTVRVTSVLQSSPLQVLDLVVDHGADWRVEDAKVGNRSWLSEAGTGADQLAGLVRRGEVAPGVVQVAQDFSLEVTYAGTRAQSTLVAAIVGKSPNRLPLIDSGSRTPGRATSQSLVLAGQPTFARVSLVPDEDRLADPVLVEAILVEDAADWVVDDLRVDGRSWTGQAGEFPARALSVLRELGLAIGVAWQSVEVLATYVGRGDTSRALEVGVQTSRVAQANP